MPPDIIVLVTETWPTSIVAFVIVGGLGDADRSGATVTVEGAVCVAGSDPSEESPRVNERAYFVRDATVGALTVHVVDDCVQVLPITDNPAVFHEYVYGVVPPDAEAVKVYSCPESIPTAEVTPVSDSAGFIVTAVDIVALCAGVPCALSVAVTDTVVVC